jgi:flagellar protein FlaG
MFVRRDFWTSSFRKYLESGDRASPDLIFICKDVNMELEIHGLNTYSPVQDKQQRREAGTPQPAQGKTDKSSPSVIQATYSKEEIEQYLNDLFHSHLLLNRRLKFSVNRELNKVIVKVIDGSTDEVIREIPPEEIQRLQARIRNAIGLLFDEKI